MPRKLKQYSWKDPRALGRLSVAALWFNIAVYSASVLLGLFYGEAAAYTEDAFTGPQMARAILDLGYFVAMLTSLVLVFWLIRVSINAHAIKPGMKTSPAWAVIWYFIPFASLFKPFGAMEEIWRVSSASYSSRDDRFLRIWWALFLANSMLGGLYAVSSMESSNVKLGVISDAVAVALAAVSLHLVKHLTARQRIAIDLNVFDEAPPMGALERATG